jgi:hypothetical protein
MIAAINEKAVRISHGLNKLIEFRHGEPEWIDELARGLEFYDEVFPKPES